MHTRQVGADNTKAQDRLFAGIRDPDEIRAALAAGASANGPDSSGRPPLYAAAEASDPKCLELLLAAGALIDSSTGPKAVPVEGTALNIAISRANFPAAHYLLEQGARVDLYGTLRRDALHNLARLECVTTDSRPGGETEIVALISKVLDRDPTVTREDVFGCTALHAAILRHASRRIVEALLTRGSDPKTKNQRGQTALHSRWEESNIHLLAPLLSAGGAINDRNGDGLSPLFYAVDGASVRALIAAGADPTLLNYAGENALNRAVSQRWSPDQIVALLEAGVDTSQRDKEGMSVEMKIDAGLARDAKELGVIIDSYRAREAIRRSAAASTRDRQR